MTILYHAVLDPKNSSKTPAPEADQVVLHCPRQVRRWRKPSMHEA